MVSTKPEDGKTVPSQQMRRRLICNSCPQEGIGEMFLGKGKRDALFYSIMGALPKIFTGVKLRPKRKREKGQEMK